MLAADHNKKGRAARKRGVISDQLFPPICGSLGPPPGKSPRAANASTVRFLRPGTDIASQTSRARLSASRKHKRVGRLATSPRFLKPLSRSFGRSGALTSNHARRPRLLDKVVLRRPLGGLKGDADAANSGYFAVRGLLAKSVAEAARNCHRRHPMWPPAPCAGCWRPGWRRSLSSFRFPPSSCCAQSAILRARVGFRHRLQRSAVLHCS